MTSRPRAGHVHACVNLGVISEGTPCPTAVLFFVHASRALPCLRDLRGLSDPASLTVQLI